MHVHNTVNVYMLTYCFTYVVLKLYVHHDNNVRLIYHCGIEQRLLPNTAGKKELYGSNTCLNLCYSYVKQNWWLEFFVNDLRVIIRF